MKQVRLTLDQYPESWKKRAMAGEDLRVPGTTLFDAYITQMTVMDENFAAACAQTFIKTFKQTYDGLESIPKGPARAEKAYNEFGKKQSRFLFKRKMDRAVPITCSAKCSACCTIRVSITDSEAEHLVAHIKARKIVIDKDLLLRQDKAKTDDDFVELPYEDRGCALLGEDGNCRAYEARPLVCRKFAVASPAWMCDTRLSEHAQILVDPALEGFASAMMALEQPRDMDDNNLQTQLLKRITGDDGVWKREPIQPEQ